MTELLRVKFNHLGTCGAGDALVRSQDVICQWRAAVPKSQRECLCVLADCKLIGLGVSLSCFCGWRIAGLCHDPLTKQL